MTTEREIQDALAYRLSGGGGRGTGSGSDFDDGDWPDRDRLLDFLDDLDKSFDRYSDFSMAVQNLSVTNRAGVSFLVTDDEGITALGGALAYREGRRRVQAIRNDLATNYALRESSLAARGLTGDELLFKTSVVKRRRESLLDELSGVAQTVSNWNRYFNSAKSIIDSLMSALAEIPGAAALLESLRELLEFLVHNTSDILRRHQEGSANSRKR